MCSRTNALMSRILDSARALDRVHEVAPVLALLGEHPSPGCRQLVVAPAPLAGLFDPRSGDQAAPLEPIENRVQRCDVERHRAGRALPDANRDLVAVAARTFELSQHEELRRPFFEGAFVQLIGLYVRHIW